MAECYDGFFLKLPLTHWYIGYKQPGMCDMKRIHTAVSTFHFKLKDECIRRRSN